MKTVVVFQGGGVLGAFAGGAWQALGPRLAAAGADLVAVGGASIGALNAAMVVAALDEPSSDEDLGAQALRQWWLHEVPVPPVPWTWPAAWALVGRSADEAERFNGLLTALLVPSVLQQPAPWHWHPWGLLNRRSMPLFERPRLKAVLEGLAQQVALRQRPGPLLCVAASALPDGALRLFDSDAGVRAEHLEASTAIPVLYRPVCIDGQLHWDGELNRTSMLQPLLERLKISGRLEPGEPLRLVTVEQVLAPRPEMPLAGPEVADLALSVLLHDKPHDPAPTWEGPFEWLRVRRTLKPGDSMSGQFDASPGRVTELFEDGQAQAERAWADRPVTLVPVGGWAARGAAQAS